ncbi:MAG: hypothetical protein LBC65_03190, partial [Oscillospiraceae bacterium]|nr:hypothetical protein [Oscillospiraceae bacterium]
MKKLINKLIHDYFGAHLDLRVRLFNVLAVAGVCNGFLSGVIVLDGESPLSTVVSLISGFASVAILIFNALTKRYRVSYIFTILFVFFGVFPILFFTSSGAYGSTPYFFVVAVA